MEQFHLDKDEPEQPTVYQNQLRRKFEYDTQGNFRYFTQNRSSMVNNRHLVVLEPVTKTVNMSVIPGAVVLCVCYYWEDKVPLPPVLILLSESSW